MEYDLQFHYDPRCYLGRTIVMICKEIRAYVTMHLVDLGKGQHKEAWYLAKNPRGLSPNMYDSLTSHDGFNRFNEARAIAMYCINQYETVARGEKLMSQESRFRSKVEQLFWNSQDYEHLIAKKYLNIWDVVLRGGEPDWSQRPHVIALLKRLERLRRYYQSDFLITTYYTGGEVFLAFLFDQMDLILADNPAENPLNEFPDLRKWLEKMRAVKSFQLTNSQAHFGNKELAKSYNKALKDKTYRLPPWTFDFPEGERLKPEKETL